MLNDRRHFIVFHWQLLMSLKKFQGQGLSCVFFLCTSMHWRFHQSSWLCLFLPKRYGSDGDGSHQMHLQNRAASFSFLMPAFNSYILTYLLNRCLTRLENRIEWSLAEVTVLDLYRAQIGSHDEKKQSICMTASSVRRCWSLGVMRQ